MCACVYVHMAFLIVVYDITLCMDIRFLSGPASVFISLHLIKCDL